VWGLTSVSSWGDLMMIVGLLGRGGPVGLIGGVSGGRWGPRGRRVVLRHVGVAVEVEFLVFRGAGWEGLVCWGGWGGLGVRGWGGIGVERAWRRGRGTGGCEGGVRGDTSWGGWGGLLAGGA